MKPPTPDQVRDARQFAGLSEADAGLFIGLGNGASDNARRAWQNYETGARAMAWRDWALFRIFAGQVTVDEAKAELRGGGG